VSTLAIFGQTHLEGETMEAQENKAAAEAAYAAFARGDVEAVMHDCADDFVSVVRGDSALSGIKNGKQEFSAYLARLGERSTSSTPRRFIAEHDIVVVLTDIAIDEDRSTAAEVFHFDDQGKIVRHESYGSEELLKRAFG
jgi:hypothetical protein